MAPRWIQGLSVGTFDYDDYLRTLIHELMHGLGFNYAAFSTDDEYLRGNSARISCVINTYS